MTGGPQAQLLDDGKRLHLQHGPIDLIIEAFGPQNKIQQAYELAIARFQTILDELVEELPLLRTPVGQTSAAPKGVVALRMHQAVLPYASRFITPMAAVAGSVADEILANMRPETGLHKIYVNNGGDIAIHIQPESAHNFSIGVVGDPRTGRFITEANIEAGSKIGGIATSGWRGRSHSMGIADSVTVFSKNAASADAAATIIANAVNLPGCEKISRSPAIVLSPDSDLGDQLVTTGVGVLNNDEVSQALDAGEESAQDLFSKGLFEAAFISLNDQDKIISWAQNPADHIPLNTHTPKLPHKPEYRSTHA